MTGLSGGRVNYYLAQVKHPQREEQAPYQAECEDITEALQMTPNEFCEFKAIWRTAAARLGNGKPDQKALYDAQKRVHYAQRDVRKYELPEDTTQLPFLIQGEAFSMSQWWVRELLNPSSSNEHARAIAVVLRVLEAVLPEE